MTTIETPTPTPTPIFTREMLDSCVDLESLLDDDDEDYCIVCETDQRYGLCGSFKEDTPMVPDLEVPDEQTCSECMELEARYVCAVHGPADVITNIYGRVVGMSTGCFTVD